MLLSETSPSSRETRLHLIKKQAICHSFGISALWPVQSPMDKNTAPQPWKVSSINAQTSFFRSKPPETRLSIPACKKSVPLLVLKTRDRETVYDRYWGRNEPIHSFEKELLLISWAPIVPLPCQLPSIQIMPGLRLHFSVHTYGQASSPPWLLLYRAESKNAFSNCPLVNLG